MTLDIPLEPSGSPIYAVMLLIGIVWGAVYWFRESKKDELYPNLRPLVAAPAPR